MKESRVNNDPYHMRKSGQMSNYYGGQKNVEINILNNIS